MKVSLHAGVTVRAEQAACFALATDPDRFPDFFPGNLVIPAVLKVELQGEPPPAPGMLRLVHSADKSCVTERVLVFDAPNEHRYELIEGFVPPTSWLVHRAEGRWVLSGGGTGTRIDWYYSFDLKHPLAWLLMAPILHSFFRPAMLHALRGMAVELEENGSVV